MAIIAQKVMIYQQAFQLARDHLAKDQCLTDRAGLVRYLHDAIRREIAVGLEDPVAVAAGAVRSLRREFHG
jgi:hypothetical protein